MPIIGTIASSTRQGLATDVGAMFPLQVITLSANATSVTFSNIPNTYSHLQLRCFIQTGDGNNRSLLVYPNNDQSGIYSGHAFYGDGSTTTALGIIDTQWMVFFAGGFQGVPGQQPYYAGLIIDILDYANTNKFKTATAIGGWDANGSGLAAFGSANWRSTSAITSLTIGNTFSSAIRSGSQFALYGVKSA